jgi:soluble lytic murein transglycosylase-like protein
MLKFLILVAALLLPMKIYAQDSQDCFVKTMCEIKERVRWKTPKWNAEKCTRVANAFVASGQRHNLEPEFLASVSLNESDFNDESTRVSINKQGDEVVDSGLMAIRCVKDSKGRCKNGYVKGMTVKKLLVIETNIEIGAKILASTRQDKYCKHLNHPWWAHYNWGPRTLDKGPARHYGHRVGVVYFAYAYALGKKPIELAKIKFVQDPRPAKPRTADKPIGIREKVLVAKVESCVQCKTYAVESTAAIIVSRR